MTSERPRIATQLTSDALRQVKGGHPWVYDGGIESLRPAKGAAPEAGDFAVVFDRKRKFVAIGLFDPDSPIRVRVLHRGKPRQIDEAFWAERVSDALNLRGTLVNDAANTGMRCLHGENDQLPGLVADLYGQTLVIKIYTQAWEPHVGAVMEAVVDQLRLRHRDVDRVILRRARVLGGQTSILAGSAPAGPVRFTENGLDFQADVVDGQKTGHFLDQRDNRALVRDLSRGARVLDVFSCTGGFSVAAAAGGARSVDSVDRSRWAIDMARKHFALNPLATAGVDHHTHVGDAFEVMEQLAASGKRFDLVVIDPPSFAQKGSDVAAAMRAYERLASLGASLTVKGGLFMQCSCSGRVGAEAFEEAVYAGLRAARRQLSDAMTTGHGVDHPIGFVHGAYLKSLRGTLA